MNFQDVPLSESKCCFDLDSSIDVVISFSSFAPALKFLALSDIMYCGIPHLDVNLRNDLIKAGAD